MFATLVGTVITCLLLVTSSATKDASPLPLIIWHGLGDAYDAEGLTSVGELAEQINPGTYVYNIRLANDGPGDRRATFFGNLTDQLQTVCYQLAAHPVLSLAPAVNALGFSQGGQFLRAYVERCNRPPVRNLVTFGSQHNGINKFQACGATDWLCKGAQGLLNSNTWSSFVQRTLVPAQYFRDANDLDNYLKYSNFLADINNERPAKNQAYKDNIAKLEKFVMYIFADDETVHPKESGWFAEVNSTSGAVHELRDTPLFKEDWIGLKKLDAKNGLVFRSTPGKHMQLTDKVLETVFKQFFAPNSAASIGLAETDYVEVLYDDL